MPADLQKKLQKSITENVDADDLNYSPSPDFPRPEHSVMPTSIYDATTMVPITQNGITEKEV